MATFRSSRAAVCQLASRYKDLIDQIETDHERADTLKVDDIEAGKIIFTEICEISLWGNATDLSHWNNLTYDDLQRLQALKAGQEAEKHILVNDLPLAYNVLRKAQGESITERRVDIILDNAGFELFVDLILAGYLLSANLATTIVLHPKAIPWFVSDVIPRDITDLLDILAHPQAFFTSACQNGDAKHAGRPNQPLSKHELDCISFLFAQLTGFLAKGKLTIRHDRFWTMGCNFWDLPSLAPDLFRDLKSSELVIFKGDLNYGKLTADATWDPTTPFSNAIGPLGTSNSGIRVLSLRTCKADVVVGLPPGRDEELRAMTAEEEEGGGNEAVRGNGVAGLDSSESGSGSGSGRRWAWSGKWAVIQFCDGKGFE